MTSNALLFADAIEKLKATVQEGRSFDAAQVRLVGLDDIRAAAGDKWDAIKDRVRTNSLDFLQGCLGTADIVIPAGDGFLVLYAGAESRDLTQESSFLQDALNSFYLGEEGMEKLRVKVRGVSIDAANMHAVLSGDDNALGERSANSITKPLPAPPPAQQPASLVDDILFVPVWSVAKEVVGSYFATPTRIENGEIAVGYPGDFPHSGRHGDCDHLALDLKILERAIAGSKHAHKAGLQCLTGFSVHSTTLQRRHHWNVYGA